MHSPAEAEGVTSLLRSLPTFLQSQPSSPLTSGGLDLSYKRDEDDDKD